MCSWFAFLIFSMKTGVGFRVAILALKRKYRGYSLIILIYIWNRLMKEINNWCTFEYCIIILNVECNMYIWFGYTFSQIIFSVTAIIHWNVLMKYFSFFLFLFNLVFFILLAAFIINFPCFLFSVHPDGAHYSKELFISKNFTYWLFWSRCQNNSPYLHV